MNRKISLALILFLALTPLAATLEAQAYGRLVLTLKNNDGEALEGAQVVVTCPEIPAFKLEQKTNRKGMTTLAFGDATKSYVLRIELEGYAPIDTPFKPQIRTSLKRELVMQKLGAGSAPGSGAPAGELVLSAADRTFNAGMEALQADDLEGGKARFLEVLKNNPSYASAHSALAGVYLAQGEPEAALASAQKLRELEPENPRAFRLLYEAHKALGNESEATKALAAMKQLDRSGDTATLIYNEGVDSLKVGDSAAAKMRFQEALELQPDFAPVLQALAILHMNEKAYAEALPLAERLIVAAPENIRAKRILYDAHKALGNEAEAEGALAQLAKVDPVTLSREFYKNGVELFNAGQLAEAADQFETAAKVDPSFGKVHYHLGLCYVNGNEKELARQHLEKFLEMSPDDPDAEAARGMLGYLDG